METAPQQVLQIMNRASDKQETQKQKESRHPAQRKGFQVTSPASSQRRQMDIDDAPALQQLRD